MVLTEIRNVGSRAGFKEHVKLKRQVICPSPTYNDKGVIGSKTVLKSSHKNVGSSSSRLQGLRRILHGSFLCLVGF